MKFDSEAKHESLWNHPKVSHGGDLVRELIDSENYVLVNASNKTDGGPFTRYEPNDPTNNERR